MVVDQVMRSPEEAGVVQVEGAKVEDGGEARTEAQGIGVTKAEVLGMIKVTTRMDMVDDSVEE